MALGINRGEFDQVGIDFDKYRSNFHNPVHYLYYKLYLVRKHKTEYTGQESYISEMIEGSDASFLPGIPSPPRLLAPQLPAVRQAGPGTEIARPSALCPFVFCQPAGPERWSRRGGSRRSAIKRRRSGPRR